MLKIGLTGGLGSGKSTVAQIFEVLRVPVYYADAASKKIMNSDEGIKKAITNAFGEDVYPDKILNTKLLAEIVFADEKKLALLNSIVHPATINDAAEWMQKQTTPYAIKEAALIFESNSYRSLEYVIGVRSPQKLRIKRAMLRDNTNRENVLAKMKKQMNEEEKLNRCDFIIENDEQQMLIPQVLELHEKFLKLSHGSN